MDAKKHSNPDDPHAERKPGKTSTGRGRDGRFLPGNQIASLGGEAKNERAGHRRNSPPDIQQAFQQEADGNAYKLVMRALVKAAQKGESWAVKMFLERAATARSDAPATGDGYFKTLNEGQRKRLDSMFDDCMEACEKARTGELADIDRINNAKL